MFSDSSAAETIFDELINDDDIKELSKLTLYSNYLSVIDPLEPKILPPSNEEISNDSISKVISICTNIINLVDADALIIHFAIKTDAKADATKTKRFAILSTTHSLYRSLYYVKK